MLCFVWQIFMAGMELQYGMLQLLCIWIGLYQNVCTLTSLWTQPILHKFSKEKTLHLIEKFPVFANVYCVNIARKGEQTFLKFECLLYKRCGILCSHVLKITNEIEASIIKVQHWKIYPVHVGGKNDMLSNELIKLTFIRCSNENMGVPILDASYQGCQKILDDKYVPHIC